MTISYGNLKSPEQKADDKAQAAQVAEFCANAERVNAEDVLTSERGMRVTAEGATVPGWVRVIVDGADLTGKVIHCPPMRARGAGRNLMKNRDKRQMHPVTRGVDFEGYDAQNRRNAKRYNEAQRDAVAAIIEALSNRTECYETRRNAEAYATASTPTDAEAGTAQTTM